MVKDSAKVKSIINSIKEWVFCIVVAVIIAVLINKFVLFKISIPSTSMVPTINKGDHLFATKIYNTDNIERGDIIVFYSHELQETLIKRVIGLPGDEVVIKKGVVSVNGEVLKEDYVKNVDVNHNGTYNVPEDKFFFLGDNRAVSNDARLWKNPYIDADDIEGKAQLKVYPFSDFGFVD